MTPTSLSIPHIDRASNQLAKTFRQTFTQQKPDAKRVSFRDTRALSISSPASGPHKPSDIPKSVEVVPGVLSSSGVSAVVALLGPMFLRCRL